MWSRAIQPQLLDEAGRPSFNLLQNYGSSKTPIVYFVFDLLVLAGRDVMAEPLTVRRELLQKKVLPKLREPIRYAAPLAATLPVLVQSVKAQGWKDWLPSAAPAGTSRECARVRG